MTASRLLAGLLFILAGCDRPASPPPATRSSLLEGERDKLLRPAALVARLDLRRGATVADLGAGPGYLTLRLAAAVGPEGRVIATDIDQGALATLRDRARAAGLSNITTRAVAADDPGLGAASVDAALLCHVDPFLPARAAWLARLAPSLRPGARLVVVGYAPGRAALLADAARVGYHLVDEAPDLLPAQFVVFLEHSR
ncbi:MAG: methyltransferase domain-containing protein [Myxococcales bacterium]|nr:methyltransferase domain-containing protein [Myxococcales bacterium]